MIYLSGYVHISIFKYVFSSLILLYTFCVFPQSNFQVHHTNQIQNPGDVSIKKWKDDKTAAFSFTFDDCLHSQYSHVFPLFRQYGFKGTFYVIVGSLKDSDPVWLYGTWPEFVEMSDSGHEIA